MKRKSWDSYFHDIAQKVAERSTCLSQKIGAILVKDKIIICEGYNGPARGIPACGRDRLKHDYILRHKIENDGLSPVFGADDTCPRQRLGFASGAGLRHCPAVHAEANCIAGAARMGVSTFGASMYLTCKVPCKDCMSLIINAGIVEVIVTEKFYYDELTSFIEKNAVPELLIRTYTAANNELGKYST